jgi:mono/diheme cytochrome c family protein
MRAMTRYIRTAIAACAAVATVNAALMMAARAQAPRTVWSGVYTDAQAERARATFDSTCARCHTLTAVGNVQGGPLAGDKFWTAFTQKSVGDLLSFVTKNMPNGNGGSLSASTYNDLVALILKSNGFPTGTAEVSPEAVADVQIIPRDGPGELPANVLARVVGCLKKDGSDWVLTNATAPERIDKTGAGPNDATKPLGNKSFTLKFVLTRLDNYVGQRMSASGMLIGAGGADGINVTTVSRVAETCP